MMDSTSLEVSEINAYIKEKKWTKRQVALEADIHPDTVCRVLNGKNHSKALIERIRKAIGLTKFNSKRKELQMIDLENSVLEKFGLSFHPFEAGAMKKSGMFLNEAIKKTIAEIKKMAKTGKFFLLRGEVGSGKSNVLQYVIKEMKLDRKLYTLFIRPTHVENITHGYLSDEIFEQLTGETPPKSHRLKSKKTAVAINREAKKNRKISIIIDEAHRLTPNALRSIKRYWEGLGSHESKLSFILVAQPLISSVIEKDELDEVRMRLIIKDFEPLFQNGAKILTEYKNYITWKMEQAGGKSPFSDEAIREIAVRCASFLEINTLAANALQKAAYAGEKVITPTTLNKIYGF